MEQVSVASASEPVKIGVLTSGGDAQGMNAAVRAVVTPRWHAVLSPTQSLTAGREQLKAELAFAK